jgi:hypothetical protein
MAFARAGIDKIVLCAKGTIATSPTHVIPGGLRGKTSLVIKDVGDREESRERFMQRGVLFTLEETPLYQPTLLNLMNIISQYMPDGGCDAEITARPQVAGVTGGCFQFKGTSNQHLGIGFKYEMSRARRVLAVKLGAQFSKAAAKALIDGSDAATPATFSTVTNAGIDYTKQRIPWLAFTHATFGYNEIIDYSFTLENVKDADNDLEEREISQMVKATLMYKFKSATIANIVAEMAEAEGVAINFQQDTSAASATFEKFVFNQYTLTKEAERKVADSERNLTLTYTGTIPLNNITASYTTVNGGGTTEDGTEGGTITFAN